METGGPGCSSELFATFEGGPFRIDSNENLYMNDQSWNKNATVLYIDQPTQTGYSTGKLYVRDENQVATEMNTFLSKFMSQYPQYANLPFFVMGESYGGHFVPAVSYYLAQQLNNQSATFTVNLQGVGIGDGWVSPVDQYLAYSPYAFDNGLIDQSTYQSLNQTGEECKEDLEKGNTSYDYETCQSIFNTIMEKNPGLNYYDIRKPCVGQLCYNFNNITNYFNKDDVKTAMGVQTSVDWEVCGDAGGEFTYTDHDTNYDTALAYVLEQGIPVTTYYGNKDLICNLYGGQAWAYNMNWPGQSEFQQQTPVPFYVDNAEAGSVKSYGNFTFIMVEEAGHMVPHDQPPAAYDIMMYLTHGIPLQTSEPMVKTQKQAVQIN